MIMRDVGQATIDVFVVVVVVLVVVVVALKIRALGVDKSTFGIVG